ncbi:MULTISPECIES: L-serine ammonia-lyase, iron-sulfur-dependent subunit beta [unclassified Anaerotruncus]|jgi:L-serine dehydratase|uniref:L-serine ammonia-lyase, iron-sulfur-dependent subunit beta n=1 Tax=unclassified Anaerotruncus TaxID=2641626 RepID=UPI000336599F|nr:MULTISPECIES: L-serine ammonia-lyase, iron-sulfur-dependent subunit beta [unclassified Anaerotruncus]MCI9161504.1 L-serine ammonia-lyase, iron-sulfur-dependent, subunit beta [Anaerotruncus sp.]NCE74139.1 L-serine ammonia-lyase, iron-sulfur-dependent, subunit beta [Anaerotruncus sp. X29]RKK00037.1 L-serine ammonia-lyase, iron-sulfur-dependent, subunit beta [Anaerotruncus sp. 1XD22-93]EOS59746.1 L-serine dehydratase, iron-sulfur-dependent, beta subunit [Anaerotruncus sp. G3(2012)]MCI9235597.1
MNVFDIIGPVMIGPSSSHTAGAARIGRIAYMLLGQPAKRAEILLHGSFAKTYKGHGTDKALIAGIMGMKPDDARLRSSFELAEQAGLSFEITTGHLEDAHPNTAQITLYGEDSQVSVQGASVGGGNILINRINGMAVEISGQFTTLIVLHRDAPGTIAHVTELLGSNGINIANFRLAREQKGGTAVMTIEIDGDAGKELNRQVAALENVLGSTMLKPI